MESGRSGVSCSRWSRLYRPPVAREMVIRTRRSIAAETTKPPWARKCDGRSVPPPPRAIRSGARIDKLAVTAA